MNTLSLKTVFSFALFFLTINTTWAQKNLRQKAQLKYNTLTQLVHYAEANSTTEVKRNILSAVYKDTYYYKDVIKKQDKLALKTIGGSALLGLSKVSFNLAKAATRNVYSKNVTRFFKFTGVGLSTAGVAILGYVIHRYSSDKTTDYRALFERDKEYNDRLDDFVKMFSSLYLEDMQKKAQLKKALSDSIVKAAINTKDFSIEVVLTNVFGKKKSYDYFIALNKMKELDQYLESTEDSIKNKEEAIDVALRNVVQLLTSEINKTDDSRYKTLIEDAELLLEN